jgi:hypothetical protein
MKALLSLSLILIVILAGCAKEDSDSDTVQPLPKIPSTIVPDVTEETPPSEQITTGTSVEVTKISEESTPKTYNVIVGEGLGIREGS